MRISPTEQPLEPTKAYFHVIIAPVFNSPELSDGAKLLYALISSLTNEFGYCWATNAYLAKQRNVSVNTIQNYIGSLAKEGFIHLLYADSNSQRRIYLQRPSDKEVLQFTSLYKDKESFTEAFAQGEPEQATQEEPIKEVTQASGDEPIPESDTPPKKLGGGLKNLTPPHPKFCTPPHPIFWVQNNISYNNKKLNNTYNSEKNSKKVEKPPKTPKKHLFTESVVANLETFCAKVVEGEHGSKYKEYDLVFYYHALLNWSLSGNNKKTDWVATARTWMLKSKGASKKLFKGQISDRAKQWMALIEELFMFDANNEFTHSYVSKFLAWIDTLTKDKQDVFYHSFWAYMILFKGNKNTAPIMSIQYRCSIEKFLGSEAQGYQDGSWIAKNWEKEVTAIIESQKK